MTAIDSKDGDLGFRTELASAAAERSACRVLERMARFRQLVLYWNQHESHRIVEDRDGCQTLCRQPGVGPSTV